MHPQRGREGYWFWATLALSSVSIVAAVFAVWEVVQNEFFRHVDYVTVHYLYITRGISSSLLLAFWAGWLVARQRRRSEEQLRRSREHYRRLLDASPEAIALYDAALRVCDWNATAGRLYGFTKAEVAGQILPTVTPEKRAELEDFLAGVAAGTAVLEVETTRCHKDGSTLDVQLSVLPYRQDSGATLFLEVTTDIRARIRLRRMLLEVEKLTSMGKMAAGTAHHLNTPLATMLLRIQMMQQRQAAAPADLERLEASVRFCQHFVQRLLEFSRRAPAQKQSQEVAGLVQSVVSFVAPAALAKRVRLVTDTTAAGGVTVFADRNMLEALFMILISNSLDATAPDGRIEVCAARAEDGWVEVRVSDGGCGIAAGDLPHVFEPFFTTKKPGEGTGLGLAIARNIATEHGGSVRLESAAGRGTLAVVRLPACAPAPAMERVHA